MKIYDNFFLGVPDLSQAKAYYQNVLGLKIKFDFSPKGMIAFNFGKEEPAIILKDERIFPNMKPTIWFEVEEVSAEYKRPQEKGVVFLSETFEIMTGLAVEFDDPFGIRFGITDYSKQK